MSAHVPATLGCNSALLALRKPQRFLLLGRTWQESRARASAFRKSKFLIQKNQRRVQTPQVVWVVWKCGRIEDTLRVKDLSVGGLFVETVKACPVDATVELRFLVGDGERASDLPEDSPHFTDSKRE